jgi:hypothetical protein
MADCETNVPTYLRILVTYAIVFTTGLLTWGTGTTREKRNVVARILAAGRIVRWPISD